MKQGIHPKYYPEATVRCACGNTWITGATLEVVRTDICSKCHPFFTGEQRIVDTAGQVERFTRRMEKGRVIAEDLVVKAAARKPVQEIEVILDEEEEEIVPGAAEVAAVKEAAVPAKKRKARKPKAEKEEVAEAAPVEAAETKEAAVPAKKRKARKPKAEKEEVAEAALVEAAAVKEAAVPAKKRRARKPKAEKEEVAEAAPVEAAETKEAAVPAKKRKARKPKAEKEEVAEAAPVEAAAVKEAAVPAKKRKARKPKAEKEEVAEAAVVEGQKQKSERSVAPPVSEDKVASRQAAGRASWERKASKEALSLADEILAIAKGCDRDYALTYRKEFVGLARHSEPDNFVACRPRKKFLVLGARLEHSEELDQALREGGLDVMSYNRARQQYQVRLTRRDFDERKEVIEKLIQRAYEKRHPQ